ncbi:uncharacterized protein [Chironomus tepperi]|uniref:uncharacterized protein isoform X2 n=1 Tax=Chironomus tepperi TaxID=113505 RepID=UPI00391F386A
MRKRHYLAIILIHFNVIAPIVVNCVQIDNELVSKPHSCFERIAIGAMLPFDKTFRRSDTNQLDVCTSLCLQDAECTTFAFGISTRGNGTCQLSSKVIDGTGSSPAGTIFDPDFDLYARKTSNCLVDPSPNNNYPRPGAFETSSTLNPSTRPTASTFPSTQDTSRPNPTIYVPSPTSSVYSSGSTTQDGSDGTTSGDFLTTSLGSTFSSDNNPTRPDDLYNIQNKFPTTHPAINRDPQTVGFQPDTSSTPSYHSQKPQKETTRPVVIPPRPHYETDSPDVHHSYPLNPDPFPFYSPQTHPHYHYFLDNYDDKNSHFPTGIYAQNAPSLHPIDNRYHAHMNHYDLYPSGRYPVNGINLDNSGYNGNRKNGYQVTDNSPDIPRPKTCFRRVLAGKRVASHWIRRTLICERLEDCQQQCSEEKRFSCEGFNYRIDPSGRGQGECELVEVPLSQMDLYSSSHNRDLNLIPHPDYDYYEKDRTTTNCRPNCIDCPNRQKPSSGYKPSGGNEHDRDRYRPEVTAIDKYRPEHNIYESRPIGGSWDRFGSSNFYSGGSKYFGSHYPDPKPYPDNKPLYIDNKPSYPDKPLYIDNKPPYPDHKPSSYGGFQAIDRYDIDHGGYDHKPFRPPPQSGSGSHGYIDSGDYSYRPPPPPPSIHRPQPIPSRPTDEGYNRPQPIPSRPTDEGYNRPPPIPSRPTDEGYNRPQPIPSRPTDEGYNRPQPVPSRPTDEGYNRPQPIPSRPTDEGYNRPQPSNPQNPSDYDRPDPPYQPSPSKPDSPPQDNSGYGSGSNHGPNSSPPKPGLGYHDRDPPRPPPSYHTNFHQKPSAGFVPYLIGQDSWGSYGGSYGSVSYRPQVDYWGLKNEIKRIDGPPHFNYFELGPIEDNSVHHRYGSPSPPAYGQPNFGSMWTRRPGMEDCSVKTSEGFRLHKGIVRNAMTAASVKECEKMCYEENKFRCGVYSYRYSEPMRDNCLLCDRSFSFLDAYADIVPDRNYDIYAMSDDFSVCKKEPPQSFAYGSPNDQCFIRTIDHKRFFKAIVRDSLTVHSIKDCEIECIKAQKFTCRSFTFRYGSKTSGTIIDNCQLSDWPVRDMDHDRHLIPDDGFDVFERASYGRGCEIVPHEHNHQNPKLCYLGYGSAAKLLSSAIKKIITVSTELECKNECIRYRETSPFKCLSFSFGSQVSTFNCEMSDLDQSQLKLDVHYTHTPNRDFWLFAWDPWDYTCRDKITSISGSRVNSDRRMDIFREPGATSA